MNVPSAKKTRYRKICASDDDDGGDGIVFVCLAIFCGRLEEDAASATLLSSCDRLSPLLLLEGLVDDGGVSASSSLFCASAAAMERDFLDLACFFFFFLFVPVLVLLLLLPLPLLARPSSKTIDCSPLVDDEEVPLLVFLVEEAVVLFSAATSGGDGVLTMVGSVVVFGRWSLWRFVAVVDWGGSHFGATSTIQKISIN